MAARNRAVEKWVTNNNGAESGKSSNHAKPRRMSHIDDEKSLGFSSPTSVANAPPPPSSQSLGGTIAAAATASKLRTKVGAAAPGPGPRVNRVGSDAAGSGSGSVKGKVSCYRALRLE